MNQKQPTHILLLENHPGDIDAIRECMQVDERNICFHVLTNGEEATDFLLRRGRYKYASRPHLVLLDLDLPQQEGKSVLALIKNCPDLVDIPVVAMSQAGSHTVKEAYSMHANCLVDKPSGIQEFLQMLKPLLTYWLYTARLPALVS